MTTQTAAAPAPAAARSGCAPGAASSRVVAWSVVPLYLAGVAAYAVLDRRLGSPGLDAVEGLGSGSGSGCSRRWARCSIGEAAAQRGRLDPGRRRAAPRPRPDRRHLRRLGDDHPRASPTPSPSSARGCRAGTGCCCSGWSSPRCRCCSPTAGCRRRGGGCPPRVGAVGSGRPRSCLGMLTGTLTGQDVDYRIDNPIGIDGLPGAEEQALFPVLSGLLARRRRSTAVAAVVVRFRRSRGAERQQMKWFLFAVAPLLQLPVLGLLPRTWVGGVVLLLGADRAAGRHRDRRPALPARRHRRRHQPHAGLRHCSPPSSIGGLRAVVGYLGAALRREDDLLISLVATGIVAVLFAPLRDRLQRAVSRLLYGQRAEPYAALSRLGERLEGTLAPDAVLPAIVTDRARVAAAAVRRDRARRRGAGGRVRASRCPATVRLPLLYRSEPVGELVLGLRPGRGRLLRRRPPAARRPRPPGRGRGVRRPAHRRPAALAGAAGRRARGGAAAAAPRPARRARRAAGRADRADRRAARAHRPRSGGGRRAGRRAAGASCAPPSPTSAGSSTGCARRRSTSSAWSARCSGWPRPSARDGLRITVDVPAELPPLPAAVEVAAYRDRRRRR